VIIEPKYEIKPAAHNKEKSLDFFKGARSIAKLATCPPYVKRWAS